MKRITQFCLLMFLLSLGIVVHAEGNCPPGYYPTTPPGAPSQGCAPIPGYNDQQSSPQQSGPPQMASPSPSVPPSRWEDRWGAVAFDEAIAGSMGMVVDMLSQEQAKRAAVADCQAKGGRQCEIELVYSNGCAAVVAGDKLHNASARETINEAIRVGMKRCSAADVHCRVYYTMCSPAVRVQ